MRKVALMVVLVCLFVLVAQSAVAAEFPDVRPLKPVSLDFFHSLFDIGSFSVDRSYAPRSEYHTVWDPESTWFGGGPVFVVTVSGRAEIRCRCTPKVLNGYRIKLEGGLPYNVDGTLPVSDRGWVEQYERFERYPELRLNDILQSDEHVAALWLLKLRKRGGAKRFAQELRYMDFDPETGLPRNLWAVAEEVNMLRQQRNMEVPRWALDRQRAAAQEAGYDLWLDPGATDWLAVADTVVFYGGLFVVAMTLLALSLRRNGDNRDQDRGSARKTARQRERARVR